MIYTERAFSRVPGYLKTDRDSVILIGGHEGAGKSTLAIHLAKVTCHNFNLRKDILYTFDDIIERLKTISPYHTLILDEAVEFAFSRNVMKYEQKKIIQMFMQIRQKNLCFMMIIPNIHDIDKYFRDHRAMKWIEVIKRGTFLVHEKKKNIYNGKTFWQQKYMDSFGPLDVEELMEYKEVKKEAFKRRVEQQKLKFLKKKKPKITCKHCGYSFTPRAKRNPMAPTICPKPAGCGKVLG